MNTKNIWRGWFWLAVIVLAFWLGIFLGSSKGDVVWVISGLLKGKPDRIPEWDEPTDPQELKAYNQTHYLRLPHAAVPPVTPFDFKKYRFASRYDTAAAYFDHLCKTEAGEYIFKVVEDVEGLYQMRPRREATAEEFGSLYKMEDPYGYVNGETDDAPFVFIKPHRYRYLEQPVPDSFTWMHWTHHKYYDSSVFTKPAPGETIAYFWGYTGGLRSLKKEFTANIQNRYGYTWRGIRRERDREFGIAGGELLVVDLLTREVLGVRRGFARTGLSSTSRRGRINWEFTPICPRYEIRDRSKDVDFSYWFIRKVLRPVDPVEWPQLDF